MLSLPTLQQSATFVTKGVVSVSQAFEALPDAIVFGTTTQSADLASGNPASHNIIIMFQDGEIE